MVVWNARCAIPRHRHLDQNKINLGVSKWPVICTEAFLGSHRVTVALAAGDTVTAAYPTANG
jgi:hypothetical protein